MLGSRSSRAIDASGPILYQSGGPRLPNEAHHSGRNEDEGEPSGRAPRAAVFFFGSLRQASRLERGAPERSAARPLPSLETRNGENPRRACAHESAAPPARRLSRGHGARVGQRRRRTLVVVASRTSRE